MFQLHHLLPALTVQENVELTMVAAHVPRRERARAGQELLDEVGLGERSRALPSDLSGGERQRVAIARALAGRPRLILADEPTGSLDSVAIATVSGTLLADVRERHGTTILIASHDPTLREHVDRSLSIATVAITDRPAATVPAMQRLAEPRGGRVTTIMQTLAALRRRPMRTFLTALGTALGIATIVALLAVAGGAQQTAGKFLNLGSSDLGLFQKDAADPTTSVLPISLVSRLRRHSRASPPRLR